MAEAIVSIVVGRLTDLLSEEAQVLHGVHDEIQGLVTELMRMKTFLPDADSRLHQPNIRTLLADVRELAYDAEHVVETFLVKASSGERKRRKQESKHKIKINDIQRKMSLLFIGFRDCNIKSTLESPEFSDSSHETQGMLKRFHTFTTVEPEIFVGFQADVDQLVGYLVDESDDSYPLISICGMGGLGKTTLAQKIYNHAATKNYFAGLAWVSISQKCQPKQVLQRLLICLIHEKKEEIITWDEDKLVENLLQIQQKKKCLIVIDDIRSNDAWDSITTAFSAEKSLSKLMLTSRNVDVAQYVNPKGFIHQPECLSPDQSWELLHLKALPTRGGYLDIARDYKRMEKLGREMVKNCGGLPLAIVILGGILVTKPSLVEWEKVYDDSLSSLKKGKGLGEKQQEQLFDILVRSYNVLPPQLKLCFLYLSKFMEDEWIDAENLYQLWIAEGMVLSGDKREGETMMQVAESYMGELLRGSNWITFPWIHKLVLLQTLKLDNIDSFKSAVSNNVLDKLAFLRHLYLPPWVFPKSVKNSKLRFNGLSKLETLKNSKLRFNGLSKLETLENFDTQWCEVKDLPILSSLRRLKLKAEGGYDDVKEMFNYLSDLALSSNSSIRYMSLVIRISADPGFRNDPEMLRQLFWNHKLNLRELEMYGKLPELSEIFEQQQQLNHTHIDVCSIHITTLLLHGSCLEEDPMPVLEKIPTLRNLYLEDGTYEGKAMVCSDMGFPRLTHLSLGYLYSFESWRVEKGSMPVLQELEIFNCQNLEELPEGLIFLNSLRQLRLREMFSEFCDRVRLENGERGPDFYKVAHVPDIRIESTVAYVT